MRKEALSHLRRNTYEQGTYMVPLYPGTLYGLSLQKPTLLVTRTRWEASISTLHYLLNFTFCFSNVAKIIKRLKTLFSTTVLMCLLRVKLGMLVLYAENSSHLFIDELNYTFFLLPSFLYFLLFFGFLPKLLLFFRSSRMLEIFVLCSDQ